MIMIGNYYISGQDWEISHLPQNHLSTTLKIVGNETACIDVQDRPDISILRTGAICIFFKDAEDERDVGDALKHHYFTLVSHKPVTQIGS